MKGHYDSAPTMEASNTPMQGFDPEFKDIVDYILRITYRIWEGKQVGLCRDYYSDDCPVYTLAGLTFGAEDVTQNTINTLGAFPDRVLDAVKVIWSEEDEHTYHTSHLIDTQMTNLGDSEFGKASGKRGRIFVIAHCVIKNNKIIEEWLVRDNFFLAEQLGFNPIEVARTHAKIPANPVFQEWIEQEKLRVSEGVSRQRIDIRKFDHIESSLIPTLHNIWNCQMIGDTHLIYSDDAVIHIPAGKVATGQAEIADFYISLQATLSGLKISFDHVCKQTNDKGGIDIAVRWTLTGTHSGKRLFGNPSGKEILIIGESQYQITDGKITEEWTIYDQLAVYTQIFRSENNTTVSQETLENK